MYDQQQQHPPPAYGGTVNPGQPAMPPEPKGRALRIIGIVFAALVIFGAGVAVGSADTTGTAPAADKTPAAEQPTSTATKQPAAVEPEPEPEPEPSYAVPEAKDFELTVKVLEKECFGSAGCNLTYRIEVGYAGVAEFDPSLTYELTYEVRGGDDPQINTLTINGSEYETAQEEYIGTSTSSAKLTAVVTDVSEL